MASFNQISQDIETEIETDLKELKTVRFQKAGQYLANKIKAGYEEQLMGGPELAPETVARKGNDKKLIDTGAMKDSFRYIIDNGILFVGSDYMADEIGISLADVHEHGTKNIPARPMLRLIFEKEQAAVDAILAGKSI